MRAGVLWRKTIFRMFVVFLFLTAGTGSAADEDATTDPSHKHNHQRHKHSHKTDAAPLEDVAVKPKVKPEIRPETSSEPEGEAESNGVSSGQVVSIFENMAEAAESTAAGGLFKFLELGPKIHNILIDYNKGDSTAAMASSIGTVTEYGLAVMLFEYFGIAELFAADFSLNLEWLPQVVQGIGGTMGITKASEFSGEFVEKSAHHSLSGDHESTHQPDATASEHHH